jgi:hypothetical protein
MAAFLPTPAFKGAACCRKADTKPLKAHFYFIIAFAPREPEKRLCRKFRLPGLVFLLRILLYLIPASSLILPFSVAKFALIQKSACILDNILLQTEILSKNTADRK